MNKLRSVDTDASDFAQTTFGRRGLDSSSCRISRSDDSGAAAPVTT
jgi:hypothetical protein